MLTAFRWKEDQQGLKKRLQESMQTALRRKEDQQGLKKRLQRDEESFQRLKKFNQFDVIKNDDLMASFYDEERGGDNSKEDFRTKKIIEEWNILKNGLPNNIFVRGYEGDNHLLRAVIVGKEDTPYHNGLFFFDIEFPASYPNEPPVVTYQYSDKDFQIHPNLEADGKVCLSLLNTSKKKDKKEKWNSDLSKSNILGVLMCIQERILDEKPYFDKHKKGTMLTEWIYNTEKKSQAYNQETFVVNCETMLKVLQKPPKDFEFFVAQHFHEHAETILDAVKGDDLYTRLYEAFKKIGSDLVKYNPLVKNLKLKKNLFSLLKKSPEVQILTDHKVNIINNQVKRSKVKKSQVIGGRASDMKKYDFEYFSRQQRT